MRQKKKRIMGILLSLALVLGMMPDMSMTAYAEGLVTGITLNNTSMYLAAGGDSSYLYATVTPSDATDSSVTWTSDNPAVATVTVSEYGDATVTSISEGTANITATANDGSGMSATCVVTVVPFFEVTFSYEEGTCTLTSGESENIRYITNSLLNNDNTAESVTVSDENLFSVWKKVYNEGTEYESTYWYVIAKQPFTEPQWIKVTIGGTEYTINATCWEPSVPQSGQNKLYDVYQRI